MIRKSKKFLFLAPLLGIAALAVMPVAAHAECNGGVPPCPHFYKNNAALPAAEKLPTISWGAISLSSTVVAGKFIECKNATAGFIENPEGGGAAAAAGKGSVQRFATYECTSAMVCPGAAPFAGARAENNESESPNPKGEGAVVPPEDKGENESLPWPQELTEEVKGTIRQETKGSPLGSKGLHVFLTCDVGAEHGLLAGGAHFIVGNNKVTKTPEKGQRPVFKNGTAAKSPSFVEFGPGSGELEQEGSAETEYGKTEGENKILGFNEQELITVKTP